ncbi:MAG TPA: DUF1080 domain-containing protein [Pirellulales bacterium]|nr:DUF1080 domain-containing protein [Pirellulales bacterium]
MALYEAPLFNGRNLGGWQVTGCEAVVENGLLLLKSGDGFVRTDERHGDFVLELDWRARRPTNYDSGIYIRAHLPPEAKPWPNRYQINLKQGGEGNLLGVKGATSSGLAKAGEWNHFKLTAVGDTAELEINGQKAWRASGLENADGYIGLQSEVDGGGQFEFRDIKVTDLDFKQLFNGQDLSGWTGDTKGYSVEGGSLVCRENGGGNLFTTSEHADFSFRFDFKLSSDGNNGVGIRAPLKGDPAYLGMEIQILDDSDDRYRTIQPWQAHGSIYGVAAAKRGFLKPVGEWNREEIIARGRQIAVILNGTTIVDANLDEAAKPQTLDGKPHPGLARDKGHIGFLGHGARIEFRNMRVKDFAKQQPNAPGSRRQDFKTSSRPARPPPPSAGPLCSDGNAWRT